MVLGSRGPDSIGRVAIQGLGSPSWQLDGLSEQDADRAVLQATLRIKALVRSARCAAVVTMPAGAAAFGLPSAQLCKWKRIIGYYYK